MRLPRQEALELYRTIDEDTADACRRHGRAAGAVADIYASTRQGLVSFSIDNITDIGSN